MDKVGIVLGNRPSSPLEFWIGVERGKLVQLDDLLKVETRLENGKTVSFYGTVTEIVRYLERAEAVEDSFDFASGRMPATVAYVVKVSVSRIEPEIFVPPYPGDPAFLITPEDKKELELTLYFDQMKEKVPAGLLRNGAPVFINYHFLNGKDGAHVSVSGISGVASKTSYALFLLFSILETVNERVSALIFNVKGEDLFFIDKPNRVFKEREEEFRPLYERLGLAPKPFSGVKFFAPPKAGTLIPAVETRDRSEVFPYAWTVKEFARDGLLKFMFVEGEEGVSSIHYAIDKVSERLRELVDLTDAENNPAWRGALYNFDLYNENGDALPPEEIESLRDLLKFLKKLVSDRRRCNADKQFQSQNQNFCSKVAQVYDAWFGTITVSVAYAFLRRFDQAIQYVDPMIVSPRKLAEAGKSEEEVKIDWRDPLAPVSVVGINNLHTIAQMFVVGAILKRLFREKERAGRKPVVYVLLDELNKYAPRKEWSPIKEIIRDIAERGRSLGIILIGAQQTASEVEKRVVANASIKVSGRLDAAEVSSSEYDYLPKAYKQRAILLKKGQVILHQPDVPLPLIVNFPFPAWATRAEEVLEEIGDEDLEAFNDFIGD